MARQPIILCSLSPDAKSIISQYTESLMKQAPSIGEHGLSEQEFWDSGLFRSAVEIVRGRQAAETKNKRAFIEAILEDMRHRDLILAWTFQGGSNRHDYEVVMSNNHICVIEAKGCLDGNNTTIFDRPNKASEFIIWSLCQNPGADPDHNAWSGLHTRLSPEIIKKRQTVDAVIIWDMLCGSKLRPCPKLQKAPDRARPLARYNLPPPCIYLFPKTVPETRNNPSPPCHSIDELPFTKALHSAFNGDNDDITAVQIEVRMEGSEMQRRSTYRRGGELLTTSQWTEIKRNV